MMKVTNDNINNNNNVYEVSSEKKLGIKHHVYISVEATKSLSNFVVKEHWGKQNKLLYKYLDNIWKLQVLSRNILQINATEGNLLVFNCGLFKKHSYESVYIVASPNNRHGKLYGQKWRLSDNYFVTSKILINKYGFCINNLPKKPDFIEARINNYNPNYSIKFIKKDKVKTAKNRIKQALKCNNIKTNELLSEIDTTMMDAIKMAQYYPKIVGKQIFFNESSKKFELEYLLPIRLTFDGKSDYFAAVLKANNELKTYDIQSIISRDMAYLSSRLVKPVTLSWLKPPKMDHFINNINNIESNKPNYLNMNVNDPLFYIATVLPLQLPKLY